MTTFIKNRLPIIWVLILVTMLALTWLYPSSKWVIEAAFLLVSVMLASLVVVAKNRESYQQGKLTRGAFVGHSIFDVFGILLAMALAGVLANYAVRISMSEIGNNLMVFLLGMVAALVIGVGIGHIVKQIRRQVLTASHK